jgi:hypothetical protein
VCPAWSDIGSELFFFWSAAMRSLTDVMRS